MSNINDLAAGIELLAFDIFGTVVDWHGSIVREMAELHPQVDGDAFALASRAGYKPAMERVMRGELGWTRIDELHRMILDEILPRFGLQGLGEPERQHLNRVWHRLAPWPDSVEGLWTPAFPSPEMVAAAAALLPAVKEPPGTLAEGPRWELTVGPGLFAVALGLNFEYHTAESLFPFVLVTLAIPLGLVIVPRTRRFGTYMLIGMVTTALVVGGVAAVVLWYMVNHQS